ncbi:hypothetical protein ACFVHB_31545 [Kitasatospora sp. NPDC127111]|uniref:hypothetical protein n=1 Tax=Kitasatospora sp. NPDC127111 TaxID=3345363 RepID=UPI0036306320
MDLLDLEPAPRSTGGAPGARSRGRRMAALAGLVLAAAVTVAGCDGSGKSASEASSGSAQPTAGASASPGSPSSPATPAGPATTAPATAPVTPPPADPSATAPDPRPSNTAQPPAPPATPPGNGIAIGEPPPNGQGPAPAVRPAITYRVDGNRLTVWFYGGVCERYALKADESKPGRVDVRVAVAAPVPAGQVCAELAKRQTVTAELKQPLAGRAVTDVATGQPVPLEGDPHVGPDPATPDVGGQ